MKTIGSESSDANNAGQRNRNGTTGAIFRGEMEPALPENCYEMLHVVKMSPGKCHRCSQQRGNRRTDIKRKNGTVRGEEPL